MSLNFLGDYSDTKRLIHTFLGFCEVCEAVLGVDILVWGKKNHSILRESSMLLNNMLIPFSQKYIMVAYLTENFIEGITEL